MCNGTAKQVSAGVAQCNMVSFMKLFRTSVARQVSRKVEPLSTSATARKGHSGEKTKVSPCKTTLGNLFGSAIAHKFQPNVSTCNDGFMVLRSGFKLRQHYNRGKKG